MASTEHRPTERVLDILELLSDCPDGMTLTELAKEMDAPKSSIMPLVHTMTRRKFIYMNHQTGKYLIGIAAHAVGVSYGSNANALQLIRQEMIHIVSKCNETCQLGIQNKNNLLYIAKVDSPEPLRLISYVGKQLPLYCTAIGRAILSEKSDDQVHALYPNGLTAYTEHTITDWPVLMEELHQTRLRGYAIEHEETNLYVHCVGVPLCQNGCTIAAISISIPSFRFSEEKMQEGIQLLLESKNKLEMIFQTREIDLGAIE